MKGQEALLAMRKAGKAPSAVFIETATDRLKQSSDWQHNTPGMAALLIEPDDIPAMLDLRCVVGLLVSISGDCEELVGRVHEACVAANAKRVVSSVFSTKSGRTLTRINDSDGVLEWPT